ncbi:MAG: DUF2007 domain-containing protein [Bauldia sp.]
MEEVLRTNDAVLLSFVEALLKEAGIPTQIFDQNMSIIEGSIGILPRRLLVPSDEIEAARAILEESGMAAEVSRPRKPR